MTEKKTIKKVSKKVPAIKKEVVPVVKKVAREIIKKKFTGVVFSDKMDKTITVAVDIVKKHEKYHKRYVSTKKYKVHDETNTYKVGETVSFVECRPISKDKKWRVIISK